VSDELRAMLADLLAKGCAAPQAQRPAGRARAERGDELAHAGHHVFSGLPSVMLSSKADSFFLGWQA
jgi:hypothetical protein